MESTNYQPDQLISVVITNRLKNPRIIYVRRRELNNLFHVVVKDDPYRVLVNKGASNEEKFRVSKKYRRH